MSVYSVCMPVSPRSRCSHFNSASSLEFFPSAHSDIDDDDKVVERVERRSKHKGKKGLWTKGKPRHKKLVLSKKFVKDLGPAGAVEAACAAAAVVEPAAPEQDGKSFFIESNTVKQVLLPGTRAKTSIVWNFFRVDPQYTCRAICSICKKSVSRGKPGTHLGTSTLQRHLQAKHSVYWTVANKLNAAGENSIGEEEYAFNVPLSPVCPDSRFSSFSSNENLEYIPNVQCDSDGAEEALGQFSTKKRRKKGLQINELHPGKPEHSKKIAKDVGPTGAMTTAGAAAAIERENFLIESNMAKRVLMPGTRTKTSAVWNFFYIDPQNTCKAVCNVCKKSVSRGRPGTHLGTSTLQRHLQAMHHLHWAMANKSNGTTGTGLDEEAVEDFSIGPREMDLSLLCPRSISSYFLSRRDKLPASYSLIPQGLDIHTPNLFPKPMLGKKKAVSPNFRTPQDSQTSTAEKKIEYHEIPIAQQINRAITELIIEDMQPYSFFSTLAFQRLMQIVAPGYHLPSRTYFSTKAVPRLYSVVREKVFMSLKKAECKKVHLTINMWTHEPSTDYLAVIAHWVSFEMLLSSSHSASRTPSCRKQAALCVTGFTKDYAADSILQELNYQIGVWLSPNSLTPGFIVSDNAASVVRAVRDGDLTQVPCFIFCLSSVIQDFLCEHKSTGSMLATAREICKHFNHSFKARQILQEFQHANHLPQHNLKKEVATQWTSTFYMLKRLLEQQKAVHDYCMQHHAGRVGGVILTSFQWCLMAHLCDILEPFEEATQEVSMCTAGLSQVLPLVHRLLLTLQNMRKDFQIKGATVALGLVDDLCVRLETDTQLSAVLRSEHYILATLLDPCFKDNLEEYLPQGTDLINYKQILIETVCEHMCNSVEGCSLEATEISGHSSLVETDPFALCFKEDYSGSGLVSGSSSSVASLIGKKRLLCPSAAVVVEEYFQDKSPGIAIKDDPLIYWQGKLRKWPALTQVAIQYLSCPPCSLHSGCVFSTARHLISEHCASPGFDNIEQLMFLKMNLKSINYDYSTLALGFDTEDEITQSSEDEMY
uniref:Zinc finger BED-type containing 6 n=1 Tax=Pelodiscus sinensis TaxID=13735 RepID=K7F1Q1_PELSI|nr:zinc finger BED domain-containing protein 6 [Pelodiscus sinensis]|eukprot:XP_006133161.1 zinc finger BED domain-containing protein 6 [Pelodiscus sinensis]